MTFSVSDFVTQRVPKFPLIKRPLKRRNERKNERNEKKGDGAIDICGLASGCRVRKGRQRRSNRERGRTGFPVGGDGEIGFLGVG